MLFIASKSLKGSYFNNFVFDSHGSEFDSYYFTLGVRFFIAYKDEKTAIGDNRSWFKAQD